MPAQLRGFLGGWLESPDRTDGDSRVEVEVWHKSPFSTNGGNCVEIGIAGPGAPAHKADQDKLFVVRDSKDPDGPRLYFTRSEWDAFALGVKRGAFDSLD